jgi:hypothetical protein
MKDNIKVVAIIAGVVIISLVMWKLGLPSRWDVTMWIFK